MSFSVFPDLWTKNRKWDKTASWNTKRNEIIGKQTTNAYLEMSIKSHRVQCPILLITTQTLVQTWGLAYPFCEFSLHTFERILPSEAPKGVGGCTTSFGRVHNPAPFSQRSVQWKACDRPGQCLCPGLTAHCGWAKGPRRYLYVLLSITSSREMDRDLLKSWEVPGCCEPQPFPLLLQGVGTSILQQQQTPLATGRPSAFWKWCWARSLLSAWLN